MRFLKLAVLILVSSLTVGLAAPASAADGPSSDSAAMQAASLSCFSITPARYEGGTLPSCDELCAAKGASCTAVQGGQTPEGCEVPNADGASETCRCCAVEH